MVKEVDFSECDFIDKEMYIYTYNDFCNNRRPIKKMYKTLTKNGKLFYKWYLYSNIHMAERFKNLIWTYLNFDDTEYEIDLIKAKNFYKAK